MIKLLMVLLAGSPAPAARRPADASAPAPSSDGWGGLGLRGTGCPGDGSGTSIDDAQLFEVTAAEFSAVGRLCDQVAQAPAEKRLSVAAAECARIASCAARCPQQLAALGTGVRGVLAGCDDVRCSPWPDEGVWMKRHFAAYVKRAGTQLGGARGAPLLSGCGWVDPMPVPLDEGGIRPPTPMLVAEPPEVRGALSTDSVRQVLQRAEIQFGFCLDVSARAGHAETSKIELSWTISPSGEVTEPSAAPARLRGTGLEACLLSKLGRVSFPRTSDRQATHVVFRIGAPAPEPGPHHSKRP